MRSIVAAIAVALTWPTPAFADDSTADRYSTAMKDARWTGPLLASNANTLPEGHVYTEPYFFDSISGGDHHPGSSGFYQYGLTDNWTIGVQPFFSWGTQPHNRDITVGGSQFTDVLQRSLGISYQQAEAVKRGVTHAVDGFEEKSIEPLINNVTEIVAMEIQKTFDFYRATTEDNQTVVQKILISGGGSKMNGLAQDLSRRLELPVEVLDPFRNIKVDSRKFDAGYLSEIMPEMAVAVGLAMRGV